MYSQPPTPSPDSSNAVSSTACTTTWQQAPLNAAACLRVLALSEGLPEIMVTASAVPALADGLATGSNLMKSVCGGKILVHDPYKTTRRLEEKLHVSVLVSVPVLVQISEQC